MKRKQPLKVIPQGRFFVGSSPNRNILRRSSTTPIIGTVFMALLLGAFFVVLPPAFIEPSPRVSADKARQAAPR